MRRSLMLLAGVALAVAPVVVPVGLVTGAGAETSASNTSAAAIAAHVPGGGGGGGGDAAALDVDALATLTVTTTADDGSVGSLRQVIQTQAVNGGGDSVTLQAGATYVLTCAQGGDIDHGSTPLEIVGNGATITMEASCEERILDNGTAALVIRDVSFTGIDLTLGTEVNGGIVYAPDSLTLVGGRVADNTFSTGTNQFNGLFHVGQSTDGAFLADGTVFDNNRQFTDDNCGIVCAYGDVEFKSTVVTNSRAESTTGYICGGVACSNELVSIVDSWVANTFNTGAGGCGGIACTSGGMEVTRSTIVDTTMNATDDEGVCGGIACLSDDFTVTDSSITGTAVADRADEICGAIACTGGAMEVVRSTISGTRLVLVPSESTNDCPSMTCLSGGIRFVNSTIADNTTTGGENLPSAFAPGDPSDPVEFVYATFVGNSGSGNPALGATRVFSTFGSVIAGSGSGGNCSSVTTTSNGYNFADDTSCNLIGTGDQQSVGANPVLGALADNGAPGPTMLPGTGSPLIDAVPAAACQSDGAAGITTDERSLPRPSSLGPNCDIGAVEVQPVPVIEPSFTG